MARLVNQLQPTTESNYVSLDVPIGTAGELGTIITINSEQMLVRDGLGTTGLDVERAVNGTALAAHKVGDGVTVTREAGAVYVAKRDFTIVELQTLHDAPITVIPAPGPDRLVVVHSYAYQAVITSPFTGGDSPYLAYVDYATYTRFAYLGADKTADFYLTSSGTVAFANQPLWAHSSSPAGENFTNLPVVLNGDNDASASTATMTLAVTYSIADLS